MKIKIEKLNKLVSEMDALNESINAEQDATKLAELRETLKGKSAEFDALAEDVERQKTTEERKARLENARKAIEVEGKSVEVKATTRSRSSAASLCPKVRPLCSPPAATTASQARSSCRRSSAACCSAVRPSR